MQGRAGAAAAAGRTVPCAPSSTLTRHPDVEADSSLRVAVALETVAVPAVPARTPLAVLAPVWLATIAVLGGVVLLAVGYGIPVEMLTIDPTTAARAPFYTGAVSNLGVLAWAAAATVSLFTFVLLRAWGSRSHEVRFFLASGALTAWLALDDLFRIHDTVLPRRVGVPKPVVLAAYALLTLLWLVRFRGVIQASPYSILALACGWFGLSVGLDVLVRDESLLLLEDGAKLFGIVTWLAYFAHTAVGVLHSRMARGQGGAAEAPG